MNPLRSLRRVLSTATATAAATALATTTLGSAPASAAGEMVWSGVSTVTITSYDYCDPSGGRRPIGQRSWTSPSTLTVSAPVQDSSGAGEQNPFHLTLATERQDVEGTYLVSSGHVATTPETGRDVALTYWSLGYDDATQQIAGTLVSDHVEEAAAINLLGVTQQLVPCRPELGTIPFVAAMAEGTRLAGALAPEAGVVEITGTSTNGLYDFHVISEVTRVE